MKSPKIYIGTSGFSYNHWQNVFYPENIKQKDWLIYYCRFFNTVELNVTFYRLPNEKTFLSWFKNTPGNFRFFLKGSRFITHLKKLKGCENSLQMFFERAKLLEDKLTGILWQLPPFLKIDINKLKNFAEILHKDYGSVKHSFEFRHPSWYVDEVSDVLGKYKMIFCLSDYPGMPQFPKSISKSVYLRLHGKDDLYSHFYSPQELVKWKEVVLNMGQKTKEIFIYFNNDKNGFAVKNAHSIKELF